MPAPNKRSDGPATIAVTVVVRLSCQENRVAKNSTRGLWPLHEPVCKIGRTCSYFVTVTMWVMRAKAAPGRYEQAMTMTQRWEHSGAWSNERRSDQPRGVRRRSEFKFWYHYSSSLSDRPSPNGICRAGEARILLSPHGVCHPGEAAIIIAHHMDYADYEELGSDKICMNIKEVCMINHEWEVQNGE